MLANEAIMSVPDQYMARAGVNYALSNWLFTAGARLEGIPIHDLIGGSGDFRRPGYIWSVEPGVTYKLKKTYLYATVPVAFIRNRTQSVTDKERSTPEKKVQGDAAFADYTVNIGITHKF
jgi:predicted porin